MKYAFIMNSRTLNPDIYSVRHQDGGNLYYFTGVHGMKMTRELAKQLADDGFELIDLCGNYNAEKAEEIRVASEGKVKEVTYAKYSEGDQEKFNALEDTSRYGIIVLGFDLSEELVRLVMESEEYNTYIAIVSKEEQAAEEAKKMVEEGIHFIELCGYFDAEKAAAVSEVVAYRVPIGYCGK